MNWKLYSEEKPESEPKRQVLIKTWDGTYEVLDSMSPMFTDTTDWAEIEGPGEVTIPNLLEHRVEVLESKVHQLLTRDVSVGNYAGEPKDLGTISPPTKSDSPPPEIEGPGKSREQAVNRLRVGFVKELEQLINKHSMENGSNTPDFILTDYLMDCLETFNNTTNWRSKWYAPTKSDCVQTAAPKSPPPPDPFEEWFSSEEAQNLRYLNKKERDRQTWDAAKKHSASISQQYKEWKQP